MKWEKGGPEAYIKIVNVKHVDGKYKGEELGSFQAIAGFECRGLEIVNYIPGADFDVMTIGKYVFRVVISS
jgi:hypothetical protein